MGEMTWKYLLTTQSKSGWCTVIKIDEYDMVEFDGGRSGSVILSIQDIRKIVREYNKAKKEQK
jgi:hypothetical protein